MRGENTLACSVRFRGLENHCSLEDAWIAKECFEDVAHFRKNRHIETLVSVEIIVTKCTGYMVTCSISDPC